MNLFLSFWVITFGYFSAQAAPDMKRTVDLLNHDSKIEFLAIGKPSLLKINGVSGKATGLLEISKNIVTGLLIVPLKEITTGISLRDEHMKEKYLEIEKYPEATLKISELKMEKDFFTENGSQKNVPFKGNLKIHGVEREIQGTADFESNDKIILVNAKTSTNITAHQIEIPSYLGIKVADLVEIKTEFRIKKK